MGCVIEGFLTILAECVSIVSLALITLDRYLIIIHKKHISNRSAIISIISLWVITPILCCYIFYTDSFLYVAGLGDSLFTCVISVRVSPNPKLTLL